MMNKSLLLLLFFAVLIIGSNGKATQLRDNLEKRATGMSEQSLHVKKMLSRKNPMIKGMISSKAAKPVPSPKPNPRCPVARCAPPRPGCKRVFTDEKNSRGCPKYICGKTVCEDELRFSPTLKLPATVIRLTKLLTALCTNPVAPEVAPVIFEPVATPVGLPAKFALSWIVVNIRISNRPILNIASESALFDNVSFVVFPEMCSKTRALATPTS